MLVEKIRMGIHCSEHLSRSLLMRNHSDFLVLGLFDDVLEDSRNVFPAHVLPVEVPELVMHVGCVGVPRLVDSAWA